MKRLLTAVVLIPLLYFYVMKLSQGYFTALLILVSLIAQAEFYSMYRLKGLLRYTAMLLGAGIIVIAYLSKRHIPDIFMLSVVVILGMRLLIKKEPQGCLYDISPAIVGLLYIPLLLSFQLRLRSPGPEFIIFLYGIVWASDSLAYYIGTGMGKRRLYREVSPNKTEIGAIGSIIGGLLGAIILRAIFKMPISFIASVIAGIIIGISAIMGDLIESMFKRDAGVKDSGTLIPAHGGLLDKIDSVLFAGPMLCWVFVVLRVLR